MRVLVFILFFNLSSKGQNPNWRSRIHGLTGTFSDSIFQKKFLRYDIEYTHFVKSNSFYKDTCYRNKDSIMINYFNYDKHLIKSEIVHYYWVKKSRKIIEDSIVEYYGYNEKLLFVEDWTLIAAITMCEDGKGKINVVETKIPELRSISCFKYYKNENRKSAATISQSIMFKVRYFYDEKNQFVKSEEVPIDYSKFWEED